jgi:TonB-linked SusC/RagA family outer membrane protein
MENGQRITLNVLLNYERKIADKHNIKVLVGSEKITGKSKTFSAYRRYYVSTAIDELFAGGDLEKTNDGSSSASARLNYFGRLNYNYLGKYMAEFVFRYDGSYIFPTDKRFGFFPGVSLGWTASEENFWKTYLPFVNFCKIRASWGQTGNDRIDEYQFLSTYGFSSSTYVFGVNVENKMLRELRIPNPNVTWEVANQSNIGVDGQLFAGRINFSFDYFYNLRTNILWTRNASVPSTTGLTLPRENIGKVANQGFEFEVGTNHRIGDFSYAVSVNSGFQKNKIIFWDETPGVPDYQKSTGHPMNSTLYYKAIGIFKDQAAIDTYPRWAGTRPGDIIFEDVNLDGKIDGLDRVRSYKTDLPTFTGGLNINLEYKNFYSIILLQWATGAEVDHKTESGEWGNFLAEDAEGRWTVDNPVATKPRTWERNDQYWSSGINNTYWRRNNDYMRLKNVEIGYNMPARIINKVGIDGLRIYLSGINLITLTKLKSVDPEVTAVETYPPNKVYNAGLTLTF